MYGAKIRYGQSDQNCTYGKDEKGEYIAFKEPQSTFASGQSLVLYDNELCLGGGIIR